MLCKAQVLKIQRIDSIINAQNQTIQEREDDFEEVSRNDHEEQRVRKELLFKSHDKESN